MANNKNLPPNSEALDFEYTRQVINGEDVIIFPKPDGNMGPKIEAILKRFPNQPHLVFDYSNQRVKIDLLEASRTLVSIFGKIGSIHAVGVDINKGKTKSIFDLTERMMGAVGVKVNLCESVDEALSNIKASSNFEG